MSSHHTAQEGDGICTLQFSLPNHGDSMLSKMNDLREERRFCDITLILGAPQDSAVQPLQFQGHRVVLAASSDFLRDQFLLHKGRSELSMAVVASVNVAKTLLLSCYTGLLEQVPLRELVSYLTAASVLQMSQVVEKCIQAISHYLSPTMSFLNLAGRSEEKETQQLNSRWPSSSLENQKERDAALPATSVQKANTTEAGTVMIHSRLTLGQEAKLDTEGLRDKMEFFQDAACCHDTLKSEGGDILPFQTNDPLFHAGTLNCKQHPSAVSNNHISSTATTSSSAANTGLIESSKNQHEQEVEDPPEGERKCLPLVGQLQRGEKLMNSNLFCLSRRHLSKSHFTADNSDSAVFQKPYLCRKCEKVFQHFESYVGHLKEHRQYFCLVCGKVFSHKNNLTHIRVHSGIKPFRCPLCHMTFTQKAMLQHHFNLHIGEKAPLV
uniref:Zinc finger and BTB domain containing 26 n=1 Tax=Amphilophus citrinellus TaxID=61819 RepID=A0A3Q0R9L1_AMPCI